VSENKLSANKVGLVGVDIIVLINMLIASEAHAVFVRQMKHIVGAIPVLAILYGIFCLVRYKDSIGGMAVVTIALSLILGAYTWFCIALSSGMAAW